MSTPVSETKEAIVRNADYHNRLLDLITSLEYAGPALQQHISYISDLQSQLAASDKKLEGLVTATKKERKEHEQLRDSTARRFAAKLTGKKEKFEARESKEEREYVVALQNEMVERDHRGMLEQLLADALGAKEDLQQKAKMHTAKKGELDSLYARVFDGPSQPFPEEDRLEYDVHETHRRHEQMQHALNVESQATELLARACSLMDRCQASIQEALSYSRYDMMGGGSMADYMERNALTNAEAYAQQVESLVNQAQRICPQVQPVGRVNIASGSLMSDVFFDNFFTDMAFHKKIQNSAAQVLLATNRLKQERDTAARRRDRAGDSLVGVARRLETQRQELFALRKAIFESITADVPKPPSYDSVLQAPASGPQPVSSQEQSPPPAFPTLYAPPPGPPPSSSFIVEPQPQISLGSRTTGNDTTIGPPAPSSLVAEPQSKIPTGSQPQPASTGSVASPRQWGSRNPYAAAMATRSDSFSNLAS